jgi:myo-inositol 2-dehydrogenase/D-chiro-inositol 1-dehydrogenase
LRDNLGKLGTKEKGQCRRLVVDKLRVGVVGCGIFSTACIFPSLRHAPVDLTAVCDVDEERANRSAKWFGAERVYKDFHDMFEKEKLDAVYVVIGPNKHPEIGIEALRNGLHVYTEKPPAMDMYAARKMCEASKESGKHMMVGFMKRFASVYRMAKEIVDGPSFGKPFQIILRSGYGPFSLKWAKEFTPFNFLLDNGIHFCDLARFFMGPIETIHSEFCRFDDQHFGFSVVMRSENDNVGIMSISTMQSRAYQSELVEISSNGELISIENLNSIKYFRDSELPSLSRSLLLEKDAISWQPNYSFPFSENQSLFHCGYAPEVIHFAQSILDGAEPEPSIEDGYEALKLVTAISENQGTIINLKELE